MQRKLIVFIFNVFGGEESIYDIIYNYSIVKCEFYLKFKFCGEQVDVGNFKCFYDIVCIYCLVVNRDVKFQVDNFIWFMENCFDLKIVMDIDQY